GQAAAKNSRMQSYWRNRRHLLFAAYARFDDFKTKADPDAFENTDLEPLLKGCSFIDVKSVSTKFTDRFRDEDVKQILEYDLDVALRFGFRILKGDVLKIAKHGV